MYFMCEHLKVREQLVGVSSRLSWDQTQVLVVSTLPCRSLLLAPIMDFLEIFILTGTLHPLDQYL